MLYYTADVQDNCVHISNGDQSDGDRDGVGDACDNCPLHTNPGQEDNDDDAIGNVCDSDDDNDGVGEYSV